MRNTFGVISFRADLGSRPLYFSLDLLLAQVDAFFCDMFNKRNQMTKSYSRKSFVFINLSFILFFRRPLFFFSSIETRMGIMKQHKHIHIDHRPKESVIFDQSPFLSFPSMLHKFTLNVIQLHIYKCLILRVFLAKNVSRSSTNDLSARVEKLCTEFNRIFYLYRAIYWVKIGSSYG